MSENTDLVVQSAKTGLVHSKRVDLDRVYAQMQAMQANNIGGGVTGGSYSMKGKTKVDVMSNGMFTFTNPFTNQPVATKDISVVPIDIKFQLQRWLSDNEVIPGLDTEKQKGPLCRTIEYTDPLHAIDPSVPEKNDSGWLAAPIFSAYMATKMAPDLTGSGGWDGQQGPTKCNDCPLAQQGLRGHDAKCKPAGMMEMVIFKIGDEFIVNSNNEREPIYAVIKLSPTSIIEFGNYLKDLKNIYQVQLAQAAITNLTCESVKDKGKAYGKIQFRAVARVSRENMAQAEAAIAKTEAILAEAHEVAEKTATASKSDLPF